MMLQNSTQNIAASQDCTKFKSTHPPLKSFNEQNRITHYYIGSETLSVFYPLH